MKIEDLFEKRERLIFRMIRRLQDAGHPLPIKELCAHLDISRATLIRYIEGISQEATDEGIGFFLTVEEEQVRFQRLGNLSSSQYQRFLAQSSLKYQILSYLFDKEDFTLQKLAQELLISEASLSRQISSLNKLLKEFGLTIRQGQLKGDELQIRYFYYQLFWHTGGSYFTDFSQEKHHQLSTVAIFERFYEGTFNRRQEKKLLLWLIIAQRRRRLSQQDFSDLYLKMKPYQNHKFYQRLRQLTFTLFDQRAGSHKEGEVMCLFVFLFFMFILEPPHVEQMLAFGGPIKEGTTLGLAYLREVTNRDLVLNEEAFYQINQLFGQAYFLRGRLLLGRGDLSVFSIPQDFQEQAEELYDDLTTLVYGQANREEDGLRRYICQELTKLFHYVTQEMPKRVLIGLRLAEDRITSKLILATLRQELEQNRYISIEEWQDNRTYDLIIADHQLDNDQLVYLLHRRLSRGDVLALKRLVKELSTS